MKHIKNLFKALLLGSAIWLVIILIILAFVFCLIHNVVLGFCFFGLVMILLVGYAILPVIQ